MFIIAFRATCLVLAVFPKNYEYCFLITPYTLAFAPEAPAHAGTRSHGRKRKRCTLRWFIVSSGKRD